MRATGTGALLFSGCGLAEAPSPNRISLSVGKAGLRALVDCLAEDVRRDGIRVGMVTVLGAMPPGGAELAKVADLYCQLFVTSERRYERELRFESAPTVGARS